MFSTESLAAMATSGAGGPSAGPMQAAWKRSPGRLRNCGLNSVRTAGADADTALSATVFGAASADVHHLVVGGRTVVRDGRHTTIDVAAELAAAITEVTAP